MFYFLPSAFVLGSIIPILRQRVAVRKVPFPVTRPRRASVPPSAGAPATRRVSVTPGPVGPSEGRRVLAPVAPLVRHRRRLLQLVEERQVDAGGQVLAAVRLADRDEELP